MQLHRGLRPSLIVASVFVVLVVGVVGAVLGAVSLVGCEDEPTPKPPAPSDPVIRVDGIVITRGEVESYNEYFRDLDPTLGRENCTRILLDQHLLPLRFAQREFAAARKVQRERAQSLANSLGESAGYDEMLERTSKNPDAETKDNAIRQELPLAEQRWLFADENVGRVSPVLETPQGFSLVAATEKFPGMTKAFDRADVLLVRFYTHRSKAYARWRSDLRQRVKKLSKDKKIIHPEFRDVFPW